MSHAAALRLGRAGRERHTRPAIPPTEDNEADPMTHDYRVGDLVTVRELLEVWVSDRTYWFPPGDEWTVRAVRAGGVQLCGVWLPVRFVVPLTSPSAGAGANSPRLRASSERLR